MIFRPTELVSIVHMRKYATTSTPSLSSRRMTTSSSAVPLLTCMVRILPKFARLLSAQLSGEREQAACLSDLSSPRRKKIGSGVSAFSHASQRSSSTFASGFAEDGSLREKVMKDRQHCARRHACDETPMVLGDLPVERDMSGTMPVVGPSAFVQLHVQPAC